MFLMFVNDHELTQTVYSEQGYFAAFSWVETFLIQPLPIKIRPIDLIFLIITVAIGGKVSKVAPMRKTLLLAMATTFVWFVLGVLVKGGDSRAASWQIYLMLVAPASAFAVAATHTKAIHFRGLGKAIVYAAFYRAAMCLIFYFTYARSAAVVPPTLTTHGDTVLWIAAIGILLVNFLHNGQSRAAKWGAFLGVPFIMAAVHFNNRRLAWVSLAGSLMALFLLLPPSKAKRKFKRVGTALMPLVAAYVIIGWGRPEKIFKPLASLSTVSSKPDASTLARNVENLSLIATAGTNPSMGTGWGHKYIELSNKYSIADAMELWPYIPHNSILGLLGFTGYLGVIGYWLMFPTGVFLHARTARLALDPHQRSVGLVGVMMTITSLNQMFGDMGIFSQGTMYSLGMVWGAALRIPIEAGVWPGRPAAAGPSEPARRGNDRAADVPAA
jgi:putative effector of murein hydrolase LrgA (UPF0299 family)